MRLIFLTAIAIGLALGSKGQEASTFTDSRDGQTYKIIEFEIPLVGGVSVKRTWMAENLNYKSSDSYCFANEPAYCEVYGRLYTFQSALESCPEGWKLPTVKDWQKLASKYDGMSEAGDDMLKGGASGMDMLLGGFGDPGDVFKNIGISGNYWDAETNVGSTAGLITVHGDSPIIFHGKIGNWHRNSVRCIKIYE